MVEFNINDVANGIVASLTVEAMKKYWGFLKEKVGSYLIAKKATPLLDCIESDPTETQYIKMIIEKLQGTGVEKDPELKEIISLILEKSEDSYKKVNFINSFNNNYNSMFNIEIN
ncbi:hypothetical protein [Paenibacillus sp. OAS669]|uniref:hypothetical protein n=1 Tax=Paenibacillus sp. OAS669 TaxID=2663821 RepID=UPI00178B1973|nr:hypothetical protein [Paenibacillus sp. OAS669]MBE1446075.1 hypothetical protein [Paenibacillus sp. OAS669]